MEVAVRELEANLSTFLERAAAGETITITDDGRPLAMLGPVATATEPSSTSDLRPVRRQKSHVSVEQVLEEDRAE